MKKLIVTADDLGIHRGMTDGAIRAHEEGVVTACSIAACGRDVVDAIERVARCENLDVGIHFTLVEERAVLPANLLGSLTDGEGRFPDSYRELTFRYLFGRLDLDEVEAELRAQAQQLVDAGVRLVHANGHQHLHLLPGIFARVLRVCGDFGIRYVRIARDAQPRRIQLDPRSLSVRVLNAYGRRAHRAAAGLGFASNSRTIGIARAGHLGLSRIIDLLSAVADITELVTHPGLREAEIGKDYDWGYEWEAETAALCDPRLKEAIAERGIELVRPSDVA